MCCTRCCWLAFSIPILLVAIVLGLQLRDVVGEDQESRIINDGGHFVKLSDGRLLEYFTYGTMSTNRPILLEFGAWGTTGKVYMDEVKNADIISESQFFGVFVTLPGFGGSSTYRDRKLEVFHEDVAELLSSLGVTKNHRIALVGSSMGCQHVIEVLSSSLSAEYNFVRVGLFSPNAPALIQTPSGSVARVLMSSIFSIVLRVIPEMFIGAIFDPSCSYPPFVMSVVRGGSFSAFGLFDNGVVFGTDWHFEPNIPDSIKKKTLISWGEKDVGGEEHLQFYLDLFQSEDLTLRRWENDDHCHCVTRFAELVLDLLSL